MGSRAAFDLVFAADRPDGATTPLLPEAPPAGGPWDPPRITTAASGLRSEPARERAGSRRRCVSRRRFRIRLRTPRPRLVRRVRVSVGGRRVRVRVHRGRLAATIDLRGRVRGRIRVRIAVRLRTGRVLRGTRTYRLCVRRRPGGIPRL